jgi:Flp pilus assembly protein TadD
MEVTLKTIVIIMILVVVLGGCSAKKVYKSEFDFANKMAQEGLWKEAHYRWKIILAGGKESAAIYNNIAVALEHMGRFEEAEESYKKALEISPNNSTIQGNYDKLKKLLKKKKNEKKK